jgi:uncharacterized protein (DUF2236 family)
MIRKLACPEGTMGVTPVADFFPRNSVIRRVNAEPALFFAAGRALLLQLAHPAVAQGVADHSDFQSNPFRRLQGTLEATYAVVFGSEELAAAVGRRIQRMHDFVTGASYRANDPVNLLWVHATLTDSALGAYTVMVEELSPADTATYYREMTLVAEVFGLPVADQPASVDEFRAYFEEMVATLRVSDEGRRLGEDVLYPSLPAGLRLALAPALALNRLVAVGTTPEPLRQQFGFAWDRRREQRLALVQSSAGRVFGLAPRPVRTTPGWLNGRILLRQAERHAAGRLRAEAPAA